MLAESFWPLFWPTLAATVVGGAIVLIGGYALIDRRFHFADRADRAQADAEARRERAEAETTRRAAVRGAVLNVVIEELHWAAARIPDYIDVLDTMPETVPTPGFDTNGWPLISQSEALLSLTPETVTASVLAYNRLRSSNEQLAILADITHGPTSTLFHIAVASSSDANADFPPLVEEVLRQTNEHRRRLAAALSGRLQDAKPYVDAAIDAIEKELGVYEGVPASERRFVAGPMADYTPKPPTG